MNGQFRTALVAAALVGMIAVVAAPEALALNKCQARMSKKDGTITVNAAGVNGTLTWGWSPQMAAFDFDNAGSCLSGGAAKRCTLAAEGSPERMTPPPLCTIYMEDDSDSCSDFISGCVPGGRPICPPDMEQVGSWCIDRVRTLEDEFDDLVGICKAKGRSLCPLEAIIECDVGTSGANYPALSCQAYADGNGWIWTTTPHASDGQSFFTFMTVYQSDNKANVQSTGVGSFYAGFCCTRLSGQ
jgi:hypothetical protein